VQEITLEQLLTFIEQEHWIRTILDALFDMDHRQIFTLLLYIPPFNTSAEAVHADAHQTRLIRITKSLDLRWVLNQEWLAEAGNIAVSRKL